MDKEKIQKIMQTEIRLPEYPINKFDNALKKSLLVLKLSKDVGVKRGLLTTEIKEILIKKLRTKKIPSMTALSNAIRKADEKGYVTSLPIKGKRQREYKIHNDGEMYLSKILKNGQQK